MSLRCIYRQIPNSLLEIFPLDAGGRHFAFFDNPDRFNDVFAKFTMELPSCYGHFGNCHLRCNKG